MRTIHIDTPIGFSLQAASDFYADFTPGSGMAIAEPSTLTFAFRLDGTFEAVAVSLRNAGARIAIDIAGSDDVDTVVAQVRRMLGLDVDAAAWLNLGRDNATVGKLQAEFPGFFTAAKASPYDAAAWGVLSPRVSVVSA